MFSLSPLCRLIADKPQHQQQLFRGAEGCRWRAGGESKGASWAIPLGLAEVGNNIHKTVGDPVALSSSNPAPPAQKLFASREKKLSACLRLRWKSFPISTGGLRAIQPAANMRTSHKMYLTFILSSACIFLYQYHMSIPRISAFSQQSINEVSWLFNSPFHAQRHGNSVNYHPWTSIERGN